jgi:HSP20 family molecular chaperone IbpA
MFGKNPDDEDIEELLKNMMRNIQEMENMDNVKVSKHHPRSKEEVHNVVTEYEEEYAIISECGSTEEDVSYNINDKSIKVQLDNEMSGFTVNFDEEIDPESIEYTCKNGTLDIRVSKE